jgi:tetratricopeptide (TPR) repeat protein
MELARKIVYFGIALTVMKEFNSEEKIKRLLNWIFFACFVATFYGLIQIIDTKFFPLGMGEKGVDPFIWRGAFGYRIFSTFGNPNFYGDFLVMLGPIVLAMYLKTRRLFFGVLYLMTAVNVIYTFSKGAWIGFASGFAVFSALTIIFFVHVQKGNIRKVINVLVAVVLLACAAGVTYWTIKRLDSVKFRVYTWMSCWEMINTNPIIGTGIGTFYVTYPAWRRPQIFYVEGKHNTESDHPENEYLEVWYDEGIIGFGLFMWLIIMTIIMGHKALAAFSHAHGPPAQSAKTRQVKMPAEDPRAYYMLGLLSGFIGLLTQNFMCVSLRFVSSGVYLWLVIGLICALVLHNPLPAASSPLLRAPGSNPIPKPARRVFMLALVGAEIYLITVFYGFFAGDIHHNIAIFHSKRGDWSNALENYNIVTRKDYGFIMAHYFMGNVFNDRWILNREYHPEWGDNESDAPWIEYSLDKKGRVDPERSIAKYKDVWSIAPNYVQSHHQAGLVYLKLADSARARNDSAKASEYWRMAIERFERYHMIDPIFAQNYYRLAWVYIQMGDYDKAEETYFRHLYIDKAMFVKGNDEKEWVSKQLGRPVTSVPDTCEMHKGQYHCFYWEDWGIRKPNEFSETYYDLGNLAFMRNNVKKAGEYFEKAVEKNPSNVAALKNLIVIYNKTGRQKDTVQLWHKLKEVAPQDPDVMRAFSTPPQGTH